MELLKYLGRTKIVKVDGNRTQEIYDGFFGISHLYPEGTKRVVKKYLLLPKKIGNTSVIGNCTIEQVAEIDYVNDKNTGFHINKWNDIRVLSPAANN
jgi:hypothetical protein